MWPGWFSSGGLSCFISLLTILFFISKLLGSLVLDLPHGKVDKNVAFLFSISGKFLQSYFLTHFCFLLSYN